MGFPLAVQNLHEATAYLFVTLCVGGTSLRTIGGTSLHAIVERYGEGYGLQPDSVPIRIISSWLHDASNVAPASTKVEIFFLIIA